MSDFDAPARQTRESRPDIPLPDGRTLTPRSRLAKELHIHERTLARKNVATMYVGGTAYVARESTLLALARELKPRNEPAKPRKSAKIKQVIQETA